MVGDKFEETNAPKLFNELSADEQVVLVNWVLTTLKPIKTFSSQRSSYEIKVDCKINPNAVRTKKISFL
ncbi:hypothetical protein A4W74_00380 [Latilactobacillus curvatus]|uniref:hypothetical protein n=1 Tax=Latilactobacillus curvatus TaxID=28038 RepID=UPI0020A42AA5|nr:hypothetical protein [Latilactobacillus curvatus]UTB75264.1 hypothetical protein A4W74_00380 [Latilactobacillus curvatus]